MAYPSGLCGLILLLLLNATVSKSAAVGTASNINVECGQDLDRSLDPRCPGQESKAAAMLQVKSKLASSPEHRADWNKQALSFKHGGQTGSSKGKVAVSPKQQAVKSALGKDAASLQQQAAFSKQHADRREKAGSFKHEGQTGASNDKLAVSPEQQAVVQQMIRPEPWNCDFLIPGDARNFTCHIGTDSELLNPQNLICGRDGTCSVESGNAYRTLFQIGSLPCCLTPPNCAAPACRAEAPVTPPAKCTKRSPEENVAYLKLPNAWPAYHGVGGAFELDTLKYLDLLACSDTAGCPQKVERPFDLAIDLGANTGYYTEKMTVRDFAKNYILVEADPGTVDLVRTRWGNNEWKQAWFTKQITLKDGDSIPEFEIIHQALSNQTGGVIDLCRTQTSLASSNCNVPVATMDSLLFGRLTPGFQQKFTDAQSAFVKIDTEGMDELVLRGMKGLLSEMRGQYENGNPRFLVNFLQFEFSPYLTGIAKDREGFVDYDIETATKFLESMGFETFLIGPRFLPLSHGSWSNEYKTFTQDPRNNAGARLNYPEFDGRLFHQCYIQKCSEMVESSFTSDVFAIRASHPRAVELKAALGACQESTDFVIS